MTSPYETACRRLLGAIAAGRAPHAVFIVSPPPFGAMLARRAAALHCLGGEDTAALSACADYFELDGPSIKVDMVRGMLSELARRPFHEGGRAVVFPQAHTMNESAQNALLKCLEEPPVNTIFLLAGREELMLPTINSRCSRLVAECSGADVAGLLAGFGATERDATTLYAMAGTPERAVRLHQEEGFRELRRQALSAFFKLLEGRPAHDMAKPLQPAAADAVAFMALAARDLLLQKHLGRAQHCQDMQAEIERLAPRFTSAQLQCIISILAEAERRIPLGYAPAALDRLFAGILKAAVGG